MPKISQFPAGGNAQNTDLIPVVRNGGDYTVTGAALAALANYSQAYSGTFTATAGQTVFTLPATPGSLANLFVSVDGAVMVPGTDYTWTSPVTLTFAVGLKVGQTVLYRYTSSVPVGTPNAGGVNNQIQYNNSGVLNGFTMSGDATIVPTTGAITVSKTGGVAFAASATTNTTLTGNINYTQGGTGSVSRTVTSKFQDTVSVKDFGAVGNGSTDDTSAIQAAITAVQTAGGGTVRLVDTGNQYIISTTITVGSNVRLVFEQYVKLTATSSNGCLFLLNGDNIEVVNPLLDANNLTGGGENGFGISGGSNIHIYGGKIKNCARGGTGSAFGGKGVQIESGGVQGVIVDGVEFSNCFMAMSTVRDGTNVTDDYGILFSNIKADNCGILFFVRQTNLNDTAGLKHTVQLNNFYAIDCGTFEGAMQFSRAANVQVSNGIIVNSTSITALIRGNHRFSRFDNIRFSGDCTALIDLDASTFAVDSTYPNENNTYDINYSGTASYLAYANVATTNRILADCKLVANCDSDVTTKIVGDEMRNGYLELHLTYSGKTIFTTSATFYLESRSTFASYPSGISMPRFNSSQITFPATQIASTDGNTLDDYEESTWTPADGSGAALTFTTAYGNYVKIGKMIFASFAVTYPATASGANAIISGLPYVSQSTSGQITNGFAIRYTDQGAMVTALNNPGASTFSLGNVSGALLTNANMTGKTLQGTLIYQASA